jgi:hypothetical protein
LRGRFNKPHEGRLVAVAMSKGSEKGCCVEGWLGEGERLDDDGQGEWTTRALLALELDERTTFALSKFGILSNNDYASRCSASPNLPRR